MTTGRHSSDGSKNEVGNQPTRQRLQRGLDLEAARLSDDQH